MSRLICPECGEDVEPAPPRNDPGGWTIGVESRRIAHRHVSHRDPLCAVMTSRGYQPALPKRAR